MCDHEGEVRKAAYCRSQFSSINEIKLDAICQGLKLATRYGLKEVFLHVDSSMIVHYMKMHEPPWIVRQRVNEIKALMEEINTCILEHCSTCWQTNLQI